MFKVIKVKVKFNKKDSYLDGKYLSVDGGLTLDVKSILYLPRNVAYACVEYWNYKLRENGAKYNIEEGCLKLPYHNARDEMGRFKKRGGYD